jgi:hypothetical protein
MSLERALGSVSFAWLMLLLVALGDAAYVFFSFVAAFGPAGCASMRTLWQLLPVSTGEGRLWRYTSSYT